MRYATVHKLDARGQSAMRYTGEVVERSADVVRLVAYWNRPHLDLGYARFEPGDRFIEWFYTGRWYNILEIHAAATDALKGWYCNVAAPAIITDDQIAYRDLLLDLWVSPAGVTTVLDEDEFEANAFLDGATRSAARAALAELKAHVQQRAAPFSAIEL
jgi:hypothetical protein